MKKKNREINIFSMSALDLFASAMGAFVIIAVIMFPYFPNMGDSPGQVARVRAEMQAEIDAIAAQLEACQAENSQSQAELSQCQAELSQTELQLSQSQTEVEQTQAQLAQCQDSLAGMSQSLETCEMALTKTYIVAIISWSTQGDDVDLHVVDPLGREYYYDATAFPNSPARMEEDNINGPGNEIWQHPEAAPGAYKIYYRYFSRATGPANVRGFILHKEGRISLPSRTLHMQGEKPLIATIYVDENGQVSLR